MSNTSYLFLADGFEEIEAVTTADVLRRAGIPLQTVAVGVAGLAVTGAHGITITADVAMNDIADRPAALLILPGGMPGAENLAANPALLARVQRQLDDNLPLAAICAAPAVVLGKVRTTRPRVLTCYPGYEHLLAHHHVRPDGLVIDDNLVTAKGPSFTISFALELIAGERGYAAARAVNAGLLLNIN
ncbi:MAG: DJ-1/PfpI family protein [Odoribacteraceae bacterium]|jgi:4-methyl-5(b-hydroxyethyl)-thiazole monophosphate biosynthesis|nr:DJ-1/PfpI family protein [Odoribacteraceae bacterium]